MIRAHCNGNESSTMQFYTTHLGTRANRKTRRTRYDRIKCYMTKAHTRGGAIPCLQTRIPTREHTTGSLRITTTENYHTGKNGCRRVAAADDYRRNVPAGPMEKSSKAPAYLHPHHFCGHVRRACENGASPPERGED